MSPRARCSNYGRGNLLLMAAICCMQQGDKEQRLTVHGDRTEQSGPLTRPRGRVKCLGTVVKVTPETSEDHSPPIVLLRSLLRTITSSSLQSSCYSFHINNDVIEHRSYGFCSASR